MPDVQVKPIQMLGFTLVTVKGNLAAIKYKYRGEYLYCGRNMPRLGLFDLGFGSPIIVGHPCPECARIHRAAAETLDCYRKYLYRRLASDAAFATMFDAQLGEHKVLACFCMDADCHTAVMAQAYYR